jgi:RNA polymerase sigma factor (sigma-70 family)
MEELYLRFIPLIKKYSNLINDEDAFQNLTISFLECIHKIPLENKIFALHNKYILSYIKTTIRNAYIYLNKRAEKYDNLNILLDDFSLLNTKHSDDEIEENLFFDDIKKLISETNYTIIKLKYIDGFSEEQIGNKLGISRQAVNKRLNKSKKILYAAFKEDS